MCCYIFQGYSNRIKDKQASIDTMRLPPSMIAPLSPMMVPTHMSMSNGMPLSMSNGMQMSSGMGMPMSCGMPMSMSCGLPMISGVPMMSLAPQMSSGMPKMAQAWPTQSFTQPSPAQVTPQAARVSRNKHNHLLFIFKNNTDYTVLLTYSNWILRTFKNSIKKRNVYINLVTFPLLASAPDQCGVQPSFPSAPCAVIPECSPSTGLGPLPSSLCVRHELQPG